MHMREPATYYEAGLLLHTMILHKLKLRGVEVRAYSPEAEEIYSKLAPEDKPSPITIPQYRRWRAMIGHGDERFFEYELTKLLNSINNNQHEHTTTIPQS